jgi:hypothetical protein
LLADSEGNKDPRAIIRTPLQRTGLKIMQGNLKYGDQEFPYTDEAQSDWSGGLGWDDFDSDKSRYAWGERVSTGHQNLILPGPIETYTSGQRNLQQYMPGNLTWQTLSGSEKYIAYKFTASADWNAAKIYLWVRRRGTPTGDLTVSLHDDHATPGQQPGTIKGSAVTVDTTNITDTVSVLYAFDITDQALNGDPTPTAYWVKVYDAGTPTATNYWQVGVDADRSKALTKDSSDDSTYANATFDLYFRVIDDSDWRRAIFFEYKGALYCVTDPDSKTPPKLWINGDRGVCSGTQGGTGSTLVDDDKSWTTNAFANAVVMCWKGAGSQYGRSYGPITSNNGTTLTLTRPLSQAVVSNDTEYVIMGSNTWTEITVSPAFTGPITDIAVADEYVFFAQGDNVDIHRMREYKDASDGSFVRAFVADTGSRAKFLKVIRDPVKGEILWRANNVDLHNQVSVSSSVVTPWARTLHFPRLIENCDDAWSKHASTTSANADNADYKEGTASVKIAVASGNLAGEIVAYEDISDINLRQCNRVQMWIKSSVDKASGDLQLRLSTANDASTESVPDLDIPELKSGRWHRVTMTFPADVDKKNISSVGIQYVTDDGACNIWVDAIVALPKKSKGVNIELGNNINKITGLEAYGEPETLWVMREGSVGNVENGVYDEVPLREMQNVRSHFNGRASLVHGVNLYFSLLHGVQRYFRSNLDDVGPNRDLGMPESYQSPISALVGYPGKFFAATDARNNRYSAIFMSKGHGDWHPIYSCDELGQRIQSLYVQAIPGWTGDRLWFSQNADIVYLPLPGNTLREDTDTTYDFTHEAVVESAWIYSSMQDLVKHYKSLTVFAENLASGRIIEMDYKIDDDSTWTAISGDISTVPSEELDLSSATPPTSKGKRMKYRLRIMTNNRNQPVRTRAVVMKGIAHQAVKYGYQMTFRAYDEPIDIEGEDDAVYTSVETMMDQFDTWANAGTVLTQRCVFSPFDNKTVKIDPSSLQPMKVIPDEQVERHLGQVRTVEV